VFLLGSLIASAGCSLLISLDGLSDVSDATGGADAGDGGASAVSAAQVNAHFAAAH
jgi:hypothetical protein